MDEQLAKAVALLAVAMIVALAARRVRLPYTIGLVIVGAVLALSKPGFGLHLTHELIFDLILPPLLFEAALTLSWRELWRDAAPLLTLAGLGTLVSAAVVAYACAALLHWPTPSALVFGALIAATDPVAIIAMFKDNGVKGRLRLLVESESLLNDGAAAVLFVMALAWAQSAGGAQGAGQGASDIVLTLAHIVLGGVAVGALTGGAAILLAMGTAEHLIEAALTTIAAFGSFLVAEHFHVSGVLATVTAGLIMGNLGLLSEENRSYLSDKGREFVHGFWEFAAFLANSIVFLMIGVDLASTPFSDYGPMFVCAVIGVVLVARAITVYPLAALFWPTRWRIGLREQHVLWWGGLRGALGLALALSLPQSLPMREAIVVATFGVVAFSIVAQGLTMPLLLRALGFLPRS
ncbi:sodium:proton antiporter [Methylocystis sp. MJC1]|uniref:cation:proton antiporter n=1 Tax=Methylocystis sp. MJC1 TaxID=2654282 RepID=UPI0013EBB3E5|nr:sodium:proton antiporter [Methylocystis sp. MJC1]KAF2992291.1 Na(+)/H(+) antiporter ApNhaP [Methylocystis sp. MJC1]MBU6527430.1 sodium:proton antiporter [Methylocystis sp. MJC1]UZX10378.1 sodium:proton antiporter [Methylocystis sp. MJC1]